MADLTVEGAEVATSNAAPVDSGYDPKGCQSLGYIVGRGGGSFGGAGLANEDLITYAMNDLRNQAAALGANFIQHDSPQLGVAGSDNGTSTSTATVSGTAYRCSDRKSDGEIAAEASAGGGAPKAEAKGKEGPSGAAGFTLGSSREETQAVCSEKHEWAASAGSLFGCSGTPRSVGATATASLKFCDDALCKIDVIVIPDSQDSKAWLEAFARLQVSLEKKYGAPAEQKKKLPTECRSDILPCLRDGTAWVRHEWEFGDGTSIKLRMSNKPGPDAAIRVSYAKASENEEPAL